MAGRWIDIAAADGGAFKGYLAILLLHEIFGVDARNCGLLCRRRLLGAGAGSCLADGSRSLTSATPKQISTRRSAIISASSANSSDRGIRRCTPNRFLSHMPSFDLVHVEAYSQRVRRTHELINVQAEPTWLLMVQKALARYASAATGDAKAGRHRFLDTARPHEVIFPQSFRRNILIMPALWRKSGETIRRLRSRTFHYLESRKQNDHPARLHA